MIHRKCGSPGFEILVNDVFLCMTGKAVSNPSNFLNFIYIQTSRLRMTGSSWGFLPFINPPPGQDPFRMVWMCHMFMDDS
jgi:hypothetical protein